MGQNEGRHFLTKMETKTFLVPSRAHFGLHFGGILESLGTLLGPRGAPVWFWRGLKKRSKKEVLRNHAGAMAKGGVPIGIARGIALGRDLGIDLEIGSNLKPQDSEDRD